MLLCVPLPSPSLVAMFSSRASFSRPFACHVPRCQLINICLFGALLTALLTYPSSHHPQNLVQKPRCTPYVPPKGPQPPPCRHHGTGRDFLFVGRGWRERDGVAVGRDGDAGDVDDGGVGGGRHFDGFCSCVCVELEWIGDGV
jgi:hypothetical protein